MIVFSYFSVKTYVVGTYKKRLREAFLMSTHNICFVKKEEKYLSGHSYYMYLEL